ncbi:Translocase of chloroplast 90 chloroplastic [Euphorbia peplus]|nr:Translocase of chloroplast 90 chloroplastic [Euphorbia peplus]
MKSIRDWGFTHLLSKSLASSRPLSGTGSFFSDDDEHSNHTDHVVGAEATSQSPGRSDYIEGNTPHPSLQQEVVDANICIHDKKDPLTKIDNLQIKFFRLLRRLGHSPDNLLVAKVLYRIQLATSVRAGEIDVKRARRVAAEQEENNAPELNYSMRILVLGKTGVGKSATINSIFDQAKTMTDAFEPATNAIQEITGTVNGVKVTFIDTPGFLPSSSCNVRRNRKIMLSVKRYIRKSPPDIVLYFERLDLVNTGYSDFPLLKLLTEVFGSAIWFNTILVMTHASSALPEGPNGYPVNYESYVARCSDVLHHCIHQAILDTKLDNPVLLVENHPRCKENFMGDKILLNGQAWKSEFLLLCLCTKILGDANNILRFQGSIELGLSNSSRVPSVPHLLSSLLRHRSASSPNEADKDSEEILHSDADEDDEYDQLPPIRILTKSQFERLTKPQKNDYLDELEYRETLYLKKQLKEDARRSRERKLSEVENSVDKNHDDDHQESPEAVLLPDMAVPLTFDSDCPVHRYRCITTSDQWLVRPVFDPQGWDHDVGFDGINLERGMEINKNFFASITGQMSKDKQNFSVQSECAAAYSDPQGPTYSVGFDVQSADKNLIYTLHSNTKLRNIKHNIVDCGVSVTSYGDKNYFGAKLEDTITIGKSLKFLLNAGQMMGPGQMAYGGTFEATLRGQDYPVRNDVISLSMTALSFKKEMVLGGGIQSEFRPIRGTRVAVSANLNSQKMGQIRLKIMNSEHTEIAFLAIFSIFRALFRRREVEAPEVS